ncbi:hypothetical protein ACYSNU_01210 [Enterococcus sp. LJL120]
MKNQMIQTAIYPTPAPAVGVTIIEKDKFQSLTAACRQMIENKQLTGAPSDEAIRDYFQNIFQLTDPTYHVEIIADQPLSMTQELWQQLEAAFPQFAWIFLKETESRQQYLYYASFVPLASTEKPFPFEINFQESVLQQFASVSGKAMALVEEKISEMIREIQQAVQNSGDMASSEEMISLEELQAELDQLEEPEDLEEELAEAAVDEAFEEAVDEVLADDEEFEEEAEAEVPTETLSLAEDEAFPELALKVEDLQNRLKHEKLNRQKVKNTNKKLELMIERLEQSLIANSISYFGEADEADEDWDKILKIDLREYTYLIQKTKYLEQMWQMNGKMLNRSERMTVSSDRITYERSQVDHIKDNFSANEISFALYESQMIEQRVKVHARTWFGIGKPHVKIMKMDYDNLVSKAAYFDLLQGETIILEKIASEDRADID